MNYASIGSIAPASLPTEYLLATFADVLVDLVTSNPDLPREERLEFLELAGEGRDGLIEAVEPEVADDLTLALMDALTVFAPPFCYFGEHQGDSTDFGFWPALDQIEELPHVEGPDEAAALGESCAFVNDHGNVTVYSGEGRVLLELV